MSTPTPTPRRASKLGAAVFGTGTAPVTGDPDTSGDPTTAPGGPRRPEVTGPTKPAKGPKFTAHFSPAPDAALEGLRMTARERVGARADKKAILEELVLLARDDASLREQLLRQLAARLSGPVAAGAGLDPAAPTDS
jgi:hypothetical protein